MIKPKPVTSIKRVTKIKPIAAFALEAIKLAVKIEGAKVRQYENVAGFEFGGLKFAQTLNF